MGEEVGTMQFRVQGEKIKKEREKMSIKKNRKKICMYEKRCVCVCDINKTK
jgi:hypothetical protein